MSAVGRFQCTNATGGFTPPNQYDIVQLVVQSNVIGAIAVNDNGDLAVADDLNGSAFSVVELYGSTRVV